MPVATVCEQCGTTYQVKPSEKPRARFCSRECVSTWNDKRRQHQCEECGVSFEAYPAKKQRFCSRQCASNNHVVRELKALASTGRVSSRRNGGNVECQACGSTFYAPRNRLATARWCSTACAREAQAKRIPVDCENCGKTVLRTPYWAEHRRFCSHECAMENRAPTIDRVHNGKKVRIYSSGYVFVWEPGAIDTPRHGWVPEHRLVMEQILGRDLEKSEHVHHINGDRADNRPENLIVLGIAEHISLTSKETQARFRKERAELAEYRKRYGPLETTGT